MRLVADSNEERQLLDAMRTDNGEAFSVIYNRYVDPLFNYGCGITKDRELVKDCVVDVFTKLYEKRNSHSITNLCSFLIISLRNKLLDEFRHSRFVCDTEIDSLTHLSTDRDVEQTFIDTETSERSIAMVDKLLGSLTPRQRQAFTLYYIEQRKYDEICEIMNLNYNSIRNLVHRGMLKLREISA